MLTRGDTYLVLTCESIIGTVKEGSEWYQEVPLTNGLFIDPISKLAVNHGKPLACFRFYPLIIKTLEAWVELPHLCFRPAPPKGHHGILLETGLQDFNPATIYSIPELKEFRQLLSYPTFQPARLAEILLGDCCHQAECSLPTHVGDPGSQIFNLNSLVSGITHDMIPAWWTRLDQRIRSAGTYISLLALFIYLVQFLVWVFYLFSNTHVGSKLQHVWIHNVHQPLADWYNSLVSRFQDKEVLEPLTASNTRAESDDQKPSLGFNAAVKSQVHALSQVPTAWHVDWIGSISRGGVRDLILEILGSW